MAPGIVTLPLIPFTGGSATVWGELEIGTENELGTAVGLGVGVGGGDPGMDGADAPPPHAANVLDAIIHSVARSSARRIVAIPW